MNRALKKASTGACARAHAPETPEDGQVRALRMDCVAACRNCASRVRTLTRFVIIRRRREAAAYGHCPDAPCGKCLSTWRENMAKGGFGWQARNNGRIRRRTAAGSARRWSRQSRRNSTGPCRSSCDGPCAARGHGRRHRRIEEIERRRGDIVARKADKIADRTGGAEKMAGRRLGRRHGDLASGIAEQPLDRCKLDLIAHRRRGAGR